MMRLKHLGPIKYIVFLTPIIILTSCYTVQLETRFDNPFEQLAYKYAIRLDATWNTQRAEALVKILESIAPKPDVNVTASTWKINSDAMQEDIRIASQNGIKSITISSDAFPDQADEQELVPERRLFDATVQFITENGTNREAIKFILQARYGISTDVESYESLFRKLPDDERGAEITDFENKDLMIFLSIFEKFPKALQKMPQLQYIVCRSDENLEFAGRAWTTLNFMEYDVAFLNSRSPERISKTIAHEKAHFLWTHLFPEQLKNDWQELGGWYEVKKDAKNKEGWATNRDRKTFISDYAMEKNPNEDMAESLAYYLVYPDKLRSECPDKYDFVHKRIMVVYNERYLSPNR